MLLTFGLALIIEGLFQLALRLVGQPYPMPDAAGGTNLGFMFLPAYRGLGGGRLARGLPRRPGSSIERTRLGAYLRAATENPTMVRAFGINVPRMITLTYGFGVGLAALAGVLAAPIYQVSPLMGTEHRASSSSPSW